MKNLITNIFIIFIWLAIGFLVGFTKKEMDTRKPKNIKLELVDAYWNSDNTNKNCTEPNEDEKMAITVAISALEVSEKNRNILWLGHGAIKFLGSGLFRRSGLTSEKICIEPQTYKLAHDIITENKGFRGRIVEYELKLASKFVNPSEYIVDVVANSAFNESPQQSDIFSNKDIRPMARSVLAGFKKNAVKYSERAFKEISANDSMGTSAAQIAAATGHDNALATVNNLMMETIKSFPPGGTIPWNTRNRLYELSYAIALSEEAINHTQPIKELMRRKVQSWAPPFGMLELYPKKMCNILESIEGEESIRQFDYCRNSSIPYEQ